jgi:hypothetical protein
MQEAPSGVPTSSEIGSYSENNTAIPFANAHSSEEDTNDAEYLLAFRVHDNSK